MATRTGLALERLLFLGALVALAVLWLAPAPADAAPADAARDGQSRAIHLTSAADAPDERDPRADARRPDPRCALFRKSVKFMRWSQRLSLPGNGTACTAEAMSAQASPFQRAIRQARHSPPATHETPRRNDRFQPRAPPRSVAG